MYANEQVRRSKKTMLAQLSETPIDAKLVARNTLAYTLPDQTRKIRLHDTDILTFSPDGAVTITTGGWGTVTTRARLNEHLPNGHRVSASKGCLHLDGVPFNECCVITQGGQIKSDLTPAKDTKLGKQIDAYMAAWKRKGLPRAEDSRGDPWILSDDVKVEKHVMLDWVKTKYVHRTLYGLALRYAGLTDFGVDFSMRTADQSGLDKRDCRRIRRYIRACLGMVA